MKILSLNILLFILLSSSVFGTATIYVQSQRYVDAVKKMDRCYRHVIDDLCGMMDIALKFRDDPNYCYNSSEIARVVMMDGVNGTEELISLFNDLMELIRNSSFLLNVTAI